MVNVGKYTIHYMDSMGMGPFVLIGISALFGGGLTGSKKSGHLGSRYIYLQKLTECR